MHESHRVARTDAVGMVGCAVAMLVLAGLVAWSLAGGHPLGRLVGDAAAGSALHPAVSGSPTLVLAKPVHHRYARSRPAQRARPVPRRHRHHARRRHAAAPAAAPQIYTAPATTPPPVASPAPVPVARPVPRAAPKRHSKRHEEVVIEGGGEA